MENFKKSFIRFDLYGQTINFSYMNKRYFSTVFGSVISICIFVLVIAYFLANLFLTLSRTHPQIIQNIQPGNILLNKTVINDYPGLFDPTSSYIESVNDTNSIISQWSFGFYDDEETLYKAVDLTIFNIQINSLPTNSNLKPTPLYYDYCRRFYKANDRFDAYMLNRTYCVYSDFNLKGDYLNPISQGSNLLFELNKCVNNTLYTIPKTFHPDYIFLYLKYLRFNSSGLYNNICYDKDTCWARYKLGNLPSCAGIIPGFTSTKRNLDNDDSLSNSTLNIEETYKSIENTLKYFFPSYQDEIEKRTLSQSYSTLDLSFIQSDKIAFTYSESQCYIDFHLTLINAFQNELTSLIYVDSTQTPNVPPPQSSTNPYLNLYFKLLSTRRLSSLIPEQLICKDNTTISNFLTNLDLIVSFSDKAVNTSSIGDPVSNLVRKDIFYNSNVKTNVFYTLVANQISTYDSILPKFIVPKVQPYNSLEISNIITTFEEKDNQGKIYKVALSLSYDLITYERSYSDILDIAGLVGGFSALLTVVGYFIVTYYLDFRYNESVINAFYLVISPERIEDSKITFEQYIEKVYKHYKEVNFQEEKTTRGLLGNSSALEMFFNEMEVARIKSFIDNLRIYQDAVKRNEQRKKEEVNDEILGIKKKALNKIRKDRQADLSDNENKPENNEDNIGDYSYNFEDSSLSGNSEVENKDKIKNEKMKEKKKSQHKQTIKDYNQNNEDNSEIILDESELTMRDYLKYKIIFEVFKYQVNSGLYFSFFEVFHYVFCKCLSWGNKKKKFKTFDVALRLIDKDTDFVTLIRSVQDFDLIKKALLEKDQQNLFSSISRETIALSDNKVKTTENLQNPKAYSEDKSDKSLINLSKSARTNLIKQQIDNLNSALKNISNSDREDDEVDIKLMNQLKVDSKLLSEYVDEIKSAREKKHKLRESNKIQHNNERVNINIELDKEQAKRLVELFPPKY